MNRCITLFCFLILACNSDEIDPDFIGVGYPFFPLNVGDFRVYDIEEINYQFEMATTSNFQFRTEVVDSFENQAGETTYVIHTFERPDSAEDWDFIQTNSARLTDTQAILIEGNIPELKLVFPIATGKTWDGNALNNLESDEFVMDSLFVPYITVAGDTISETLTVIQEDNQEFIVNLISNHEIYGLNMGLVYKEEIDLKYCREDDCIGQQVVDNGRIFRQSLVEYGTD